MIKTPELVRTADGSNTLYNEEIGEHYHSRHGAVGESRHVFRAAGLQYVLEKQGAIQATVLEVGFGTGLNFLLSAEHCLQNNAGLRYCGIEAYPLGSDIIHTTGYERYISEPLWHSFTTQYATSFRQPVQVAPAICLEVHHCKALEFNHQQLFDVLYFDAFASVHQPEMWNDETLSHVCRFLKPGGVFVTYAITGNLKRSMKSLGFTVQKLPGAPGKREMLRAINFS
jgi:tRNA U34 5-methylaminomethyl-2-thiouridine-forming methyltransferase MnmC